MGERGGDKHENKYDDRDVARRKSDNQRNTDGDFERADQVGYDARYGNA